jgi:primary-amine oxidase
LFGPLQRLFRPLQRLFGPLQRLFPTSGSWSMPGWMTPHPLDPLGPEEIRQAAAILRRDRGVGPGWRFASIELREPSKAVVRGWRGDGGEREARVVCWNREDGTVYRALVSLTADAVLSWDEVPDGQPNMTVDEVTECDAAMRREPRVIEALGRRGITDMDRVLVEAWAYGAHLLPEPYSDRRLGWADAWYRSEAGSNPYANPVTGLHLVIDLNAMKLLEVEDTGAIDEPATMGEYLPRLVPGLQPRDDVRPLEITQPDGPSFVLDGNLLRWQRWSMRIGFNYREGLVLHTVGYEESGGARSVAHRLSFAEMVVPYRDPTSEHYRRTAFDIGEWAWAS